MHSGIIFLSFNPCQPRKLLEVVISSGWLSPQLHYSSTVIAQDEVERLPKASKIEKHYHVKAKQLFDAYDEFLEGIVKKQPLPDNLFTKQLGPYRLIPTLKEGWKSLALPRDHVDRIEICMYMIGLLGLGECEPYYDFVFNETTKDYYFFIEFKFKRRGNTTKRLLYKPFTCRVDKTTVDCFKKIITIQDTFTIEKSPDLNEVLLLLTYTSFVEGLGTPSKGSFSLKSNHCDSNASLSRIL